MIYLHIFLQKTITLERKKTLNSYYGDSINSIEFSEEKREPNPARLLRAYSQSASTLNLLRSFAQGGFANLRKVNSWNMGFSSRSYPNG